MGWTLWDEYNLMFLERQSIVSYPALAPPWFLSTSTILIANWGNLKRSGKLVQGCTQHGQMFLPVVGEGVILYIYYKLGCAIRTGGPQPLVRRCSNLDRSLRRNCLIHRRYTIPPPILYIMVLYHVISYLLIYYSLMIKYHYM